MRPISVDFPASTCPTCIEEKLLNAKCKKVATINDTGGTRSYQKRPNKITTSLVE